MHVSLRVEREHADVGLVTFEEERVLALRGDLVDLAVIAGSDVEISGLVEKQSQMYFVPGAKYSDELHEGSRAGLAGSLVVLAALSAFGLSFGFGASLLSPGLCSIL